MADSQPSYTIVLSTNDLATIGAALGELPHKLAQPVITRIQKQINEQEQPKGIVTPDTE